MTRFGGKWRGSTFGNYELADAGAQDGFSVSEARVGCFAGAFELGFVAGVGGWVGGFEERHCTLIILVLNPTHNTVLIELTPSPSCPAHWPLFSSIMSDNSNLWSIQLVT